MAKMMNPNTTIWWVPEGGFEDPANPTAAEINAGENLSCAIVTGFTLNPTDSDTDDTRSICDEGNVANPTWDNYEANLTFFRTTIGEAAQEGTVDAVMETAFNLFRHKGKLGYLVRRVGKKYHQPAADGDIVSVFKVLSDNPQDIAGGDEGPIQLTVPFLPQGEMHLNVDVGGGETGN